MVVLIIAGLLAVAVGTYLTLTSQENLKVKRSNGWNTALPMAEAGIEEACSQVNRNTNGPNAWAYDGWVFNTNTSAYNKTRFLSDGYYSVDLNGWPGGIVAMTSTGYGCWTGSNYITRRVQVTAQTPAPYYPSGLIANNITFNGNFMADSFDSSTNLYSTAGLYDPKKATDHALIATPPGSTGFVITGTVRINGFVATAVGGVVNITGAGIVGDFGYNVSGTIQSGHYTNGFTTVFPPVLPPFGPNTPGVRTPMSGTNAGVAYTYLLNGGFYYASNLTAVPGGTIYVAAPSTLMVPGNVDLSQITFGSNLTNPPTLSLFFGGSSITFGASLVNGSPPQFWVYGLPSCTSMKMTGLDFVGVIYAPTMNLSAQGGSISGAVVANSFSCQGNFRFHSDDAASTGKAAKKFKILSWAEL
jgi:hypothetical protein